MPKIVPAIASELARLGGGRLLRLFLIAGFGLALGACSKCDMPTWRHDSPQSCHGDAPVQ